MGFWRKFGKFASIAAPIVAAPFTGGASLALIGAGAGAAHGALSGGGVKGALLGAGLGAIPGAGAAKGATGVAKNLTTKGVLSSIGKSALSNGALGKFASAASPALTGVASGMQKGREAENAAARDAATFALREREGNEQALQNRAGLDLRQREFAQGSQNNAYRNAIRSAIAKNLQDVTLGGVPKGVTPVSYGGGLRPSALGPEGREAADVMNRKAMMSLMNGEKFNPLPAIERTAAPAFKKAGKWENILGGAAVGTSALAGYNAQKEQSDFQQKLMDAINAISNPQTPGAPIVKPPMGGNGGVMPWGRIPTAVMQSPKPQNPYDDGQ